MAEQHAWIPCSERMPENGVSVIAREQFYGEVGEAYCWHGRWVYAGERKDYCSVTHWMPMPEFPEELETFPADDAQPESP